MPIPRQVPAAPDPRVLAVLAPRWHAARGRLLLAVAMPVVVVVLCAGMLALATTGQDGSSPWVWILLLGPAGPAAAVLWWVRRGGYLHPAECLRILFVVAGAQLLVGGIPCVGVTVNATSGAASVVATVLFMAIWVCGAVAVVAARRAHRALVTPMVPELGATAFLVTVPARFALTAPALVSARIEIGADRIEWTARLHRGRSAGPRVDAAIRFADLREVTPIMLPPEPDLTPWLTLPNGTVLYAQPGPAVLLTSGTGTWMVPVPDAITLAGLITRRIGAGWRTAPRRPPAGNNR